MNQFIIHELFIVGLHIWTRLHYLINIKVFNYVWDVNLSDHRQFCLSDCHSRCSNVPLEDLP